VLKNNGPSKCAGSSTARSLAGHRLRLALTISDETRGSSRVMSCSPAPGTLLPGTQTATFKGWHSSRSSRRQQHAAQVRQARRWRCWLRRPKPAPLSEPPILTLVRPRRRLTFAPTADQFSRRAQQPSMDGRHANRKACSPLPGRSLTAASTVAQLGGSGPDGATHTSLAARQALLRASIAGGVQLPDVSQKSLSDEGSLLCSGGEEGAHSSRKASLICAS
jgi:hypothetical protein